MNINTLSEKIHSTKFDITIDTCSAMHDGFSQFIKKNKAWFAKAGIRISVSRDVVMELVRKLECENTSGKALRAIALLKDNEDIFDIDIVPMTDEDISNAFADSELLNRINTGRLHRPQVLITNDNDLNGDAQRLNDLQSCRGKQVFVVYLDSAGDMKTNKSLKNYPDDEANNPPAAYQFEESSAVSDVHTGFETVVDNPLIQIRNDNGLKKACKATGLVLLGVIADRYGPSVLQTCSKMIKTFMQVA